MTFNSVAMASPILSCRRQGRGANVSLRMYALTLTAAICSPQFTLAQTTGTVDSSNIGVATEDAVISSGLPTVNLDFRMFNDAEISQQLMNTTAGDDYPTPADGAAAQEYMIFKFDLSTLPSGAQATATGSFDFSAWFTLNENTETEPLFGGFRFYEITAGNAAWQDRWVVAGVENTTPVTFSNLNGVFSELTGVTEDNTDPPNSQTGNPFGVLYPDQLVSNGGFDGANRIVGIPIETLNRLISGQSVGLALGSIAPNSTSPSADFDGDGTVDGSDLTVNWQGGFGTETGATKAQGDADGDGDVDGDDFLAWQTQLGSVGVPATEGRTNFSIHTTETFFSPASAPTLNFDWSAPAVASVPEPMAGGLMALGVGGLLLRQRAKPSRPKTVG